MSEEAQEEVTEEVVEESTLDPIEDIARSHGWKPETEWKGDPPENGFKSANDFIRDGFSIQSKQHDKIERLQGTIESVETNIKNMAASETKRLKTALESQKERILAERQEAFDEQDNEAFNKADKELQETHVQIQEAEEQAPDPAFVAGEATFRERNKWFGEDQAMTATVMMAAEKMGAGMSATEYYAALEDVAKAHYPDKFRNTNRDKGGMVSGDNPKSNAKKGKGFESLSPEEKHAYAEIIQYTPDFSKADYAKQILEQE